MPPPPRQHTGAAYGQQAQFSTGKPVTANKSESVVTTVQLSTLSATAASIM